MAKVSETIERIANSTHLLATQRLVVAIGLPIAGVLATFSGNWLIDTTEANTSAIRNMERDNAKTLTALKLMTETVLPNAMTVLNDRINIHAGRMEKLEAKVDMNMKEVRDLDSAMKEKFTALMEKLYERAPPVPFNRGDTRAPER